MIEWLNIYSGRIGVGCFIVVLLCSLQIQIDRLKETVEFNSLRIGSLQSELFSTYGEIWENEIHIEVLNHKSLRNKVDIDVLENEIFRRRKR